MPPKILFTCEHGYPHILDEYSNESMVLNKILDSHRGFDYGAAEMSRRLGEASLSQLMIFYITRLLVDSNRKLSEQKSFVNKLENNQTLLQAYQEYRQHGYQTVDNILKEGHSLLILSMHSFTPIYKGKVRATDIGLLFRPNIEKELDLAKKIKSKLQRNNPLKVHLNRPYRGHTDCYLNDLLDHYHDRPVTGLCIELNHKILRDRSSFEFVYKQLLEAIQFLQQPSDSKVLA